RANRKRLFFLVVIIIVVVIIVIVAHFAELERRGAHHFKFGAALGAGDGLALIDFVFFEVHVGFAIRTKYHRVSPLSGYPFVRGCRLYLESLGAAVKCFAENPWFTRK